MAEVTFPFLAFGQALPKQVNLSHHFMKATIFAV
jgi:hypothetical protein